MKLVGRLSAVALIVIGLVAVQAFADRESWHLPWYFIQELTLGAVPMIWLLLEVLPGLPAGDRRAFIVTSSAFVTLASIFELVAIQKRYWWFYQDIDRLSGLRIGDIPLEEFLYYPILLNIPVLLYLLLRRRSESAPAAALGARLRAVLWLVAGGLATAALALFVLAFINTTPTLDLSIQPAPDAAGAIRYAAGPPQRAWTILQLASLAVALVVYTRLRERLHQRALLLMVAIYFPYALFLELMACGRGWWVWNAQQTSGWFTWVLPVDSYAMYVTGALLPVLLYETLRRYFTPAAPA